MRMIFLNFPVADIGRTRAFFEALGFTNNPAFSDERCTCMVIEENIICLFQQTDRFKEFLADGTAIADAPKTVELLTALSVGSREECDTMRATALANGGAPWKDAIDYGFMYGTSFCDPDGHVWELSWMDPAQTPQ